MMQTASMASRALSSRALASASASRRVSLAFFSQSASGPGRWSSVRSTPVRQSVRHCISHRHVLRANARDNRDSAVLWSVWERQSLTLAHAGSRISTLPRPDPAGSTCPCDVEYPCLCRGAGLLGCGRGRDERRRCACAFCPVSHGFAARRRGQDGALQLALCEKHGRKDDSAGRRHG